MDDQRPFRDGLSSLPRRPGEDIVAYVERVAKHLGLRVGPGVRSMPEGTRMPYREPGEDDDSE